ncbi:MAG: erythromycin esterase family protein [Verrucomicrobia bacterium]|nr:erythromycin esterase family protein [Verrucomicrobiota bacterium]
MSDLKLALRQLLKFPRCTAAARLTLAWATASCGITGDTGVPAGPAITKPVVCVESGESSLRRVHLDRLGTLIGDARVVILGEPELGMHEPLAFRNHLFEYLVGEKGFTAIAVESAFPESRSLATYVGGGPETAEDALANSRTWWHEPLEENLHLVRWMRSHNTRPNCERPLRLYAIDLSYTGPWGSRPTPLALEAVLGYLDKVDSTAARTHRTALTPWMLRLANPTASWTRPEHDAFTAAIEDTVAHLACERVTCLAAGSAAEYEWARQAVSVAQQTDRMFRVAPSEPPGERVPPSAWRMVNARDAAMAENVLWALRQEGEAGRVLVITHSAHARTAATTGGPWDSYDRRPTSMGQYLRASLGGKLVAVGMGEGPPTTPEASGFDGWVGLGSLTAARPLVREK